jgi:ABC-type polysaccharide/polyol phosphate transport system ATPase subunit
VGDKNFREKSYKTFMDYKEKKKTILYATHNFENLSKFCNLALLLNQGKQIMLGKPEEVIEKYNEITVKKI